MSRFGSGSTPLWRKVLTALTSTVVIFALGAPASVKAAGDASQEITFNSIENFPIGHGLVELTVSSDSGLYVTVEAFESDGVCSVTGHEVTLQAIGDCHLRATQAGNDTYAAAEPVERSFLIIENANDSITSFTLNGDTDMQYGERYEAVPGYQYDNYFSIDWTVDGDTVPTITSITPDVCQVSTGAPFDSTVGYFVAAGDCMIEASLYGESTDDDVYANILIKRGDATLTPEPYVANHRDYSTGINPSLHVLEMFDRPDLPQYVINAGNYPQYHIDGSAGFKYDITEENPECRQGVDADEGSNPSMPLYHAGECLVMVHAQKGDNWQKSEASNVTVRIRKMYRYFAHFDYGVGDGYGREVARTTQVGYLGDPYFIEAAWPRMHWAGAPYEDTNGIEWTLLTGNCLMDDYDDTVGVLVSDSSGGDQCKVRLSLPETQDYKATESKTILMKFMREPGKIQFAKIPNFTLVPGGGDVFNVEAYVKSLTGGSTHMADSHRPRLSFGGSCEDRDLPVPTGPGDNPHNSTTDRSTGYVTGAGLCTVTASVDSDYNVSAGPVKRSFSIVKSSNTITFSTISNHGAGDTLVEDTDFNLYATWFQPELSTASAACSVSENEESGKWEIELLTPGLCKVTATRGATARVKAAASVTRIFTVTKATGRIVLGVDITGNGKYGNMYLPGDECYGAGDATGGCLGGDDQYVLYNPVNNRVFNIDSVDNSDGTVTYSKESGACAVSNAAKTVTITGRNAAGTCVVKVNLGASAAHTAGSDTFTINVNRADGTIGFWTTPGPLNIGTNVTLNGVSEAGTVVYSTADAGICSVSGATLTPVSEGTCTIYADVPTNDAYNAAPQREYSVSVSKATQTISFTTTAQRTYPSGSNVITVSPTTTAVGLTVSVTLGEGSTGCTSGGAGGKTITFTGVGTCILVASQAGNGTYQAADDVTRTIVISKKPVAVTAPTVSIPLARTGQMATRTQGDWTGSGGTLVYSTEWYRCTSSSAATPTTSSVSGCSLVGATGATYTAGAADLNKYLRVRITVSNFSGTSYRWSATTAKILAP